MNLNVPRYPKRKHGNLQTLLDLAVPRMLTIITTWEL